MKRLCPLVDNSLTGYIKAYIHMPEDSLSLIDSTGTRDSDFCVRNTPEDFELAVDIGRPYKFPISKK